MERKNVPILFLNASLCIQISKCEQKKRFAETIRFAIASDMVRNKNYFFTCEIKFIIFVLWIHNEWIQRMDTNIF